VAQTGEPYFLSLNLNPDLEAKAKADPNGFLDHMSRRVRRYLKKILGRVPELVLVAGNEKGRLHIHGIIGLDPNEVPRAREALLAAGGTWSHKRGQQHQLDLQPIPAAQLDIKSGYLVKNMDQARAILSARKVTITSAARARAEALYEVERADINAYLDKSRPAEKQVGRGRRCAAEWSGPSTDLANESVDAVGRFPDLDDSVGDRSSARHGINHSDLEVGRHRFTSHAERILWEVWGNAGPPQSARTCCSNPYLEA
jgi:hypothetical protein